MIGPDLQKVYAGSTSNRVLETLRFNHVTWSQPQYIVNDYKDWFLGVGVGSINYRALPFALKLPDKNTSGRQDLSISMCNIGREMLDLLEQANADPLNNIEVIYRVYLDIPQSDPQNDPPLTLSITNVAIDQYNLTATATRFDVLNKVFPTVLYNGVDFPGLLR